MITAHSEYGTIKKLYINRISDSFLSPEKVSEEWVALNYLSKPDFDNSLSEYAAFEDILSRHAEDVFQYGTNVNLTLDSLYCRDASITTDFGIILCNMGKSGRVNEPGFAKKIFERDGIKILGAIESPGTLEGGDVAWVDTKTLAVGHTYRTNNEGIRQLKDLLEPHGVEVIVSEMPHYKGESDVFHLMSVFSPVDQKIAVVYSPLMPISFRSMLIDRGFQLVEVPDSEFDSQGCNVLGLGNRTCLMVKGNPITAKRIQNAGCEVIEYNGDDISVKGGGGPTCLTRPLLREIN